MKRLLLAVAFCALATPAGALFDTAAPGLVQIVDPTAPNTPLGTVSHPLNTTGTFSGTIGGFPAGTGGVVGTPVSAQTTVTTGSTQTLPAGTEVVATNAGTTNMAYCQLVATASVNSQPIAPNGGWFGFTVGSATQITCVTSTSTTTVNTFGGAGLPTGTGGGGGGGGSGGNVTVVGPLGTQTNAASVAVTPATSSVWAGPLGTQSIANSQAVTPATSSIWGGPLGTQAIGSSQAVNPATSSVWPTIYGPNQASITGNITVVDSGVTCASTAGGQTQCTGTPTAGSFVSGQINGAGCIGVSSALSGGTATAAMSTEISQDNINFYPRGLFLDGKNAPIWTNNITGGVFAGQTPGGGVLYYRVRASTLSTLTGSPSFAIVILPSQAACVNYDGNLPTAANGSGSVASVNIQGGGGSALNVGTNEIQQGGVAIAAPTAIGTSASGNIQGVQGVTGGVPMPISGTVTASLGGFTPSAAGARMTPITVGTTDTSGTLPTGGVVVVSNVGSTNVMYCNVNSLAAQTSDQPISPGGGWFAFTIPSGVTLLHCISPAGGTTANGIGGAGLATGTGGGGGAPGSSGNVFQANAFAVNVATTATTTQQFAASGSTVIYLVNYSEQTDYQAAADGTFQIVTGTGTNCATSQVALTPFWDFPPGQGIQEGSIGVLGVGAPGAALCVQTSTANKVRWRIGIVQQ